MSQIISGFNTNSDTMLYVSCPTCGIRAEINLPRFIVAINRRDKFTCGDCKCKFTIKLVCLTRDAEQRRVPDSASLELLRRFYQAWQAREDDDGWRCIRCGKLLSPRLGG